MEGSFFSSPRLFLTTVGSTLSHPPRTTSHLLPLNCVSVLDSGGSIEFPGSASLLMATEDYEVKEAKRLVEKAKIDLILIMIGRSCIYEPVCH